MSETTPPRPTAEDLQRRMEMAQSDARFFLGLLHFAMTANLALVRDMPREVAAAEADRLIGEAIEKFHAARDRGPQP